MEKIDLVDYFAAHALNGLLSNKDHIKKHCNEYGEIESFDFVEQSYEIAVAMMRHKNSLKFETKSQMIEIRHAEFETVVGFGVAYTEEEAKKQAEKHLAIKIQYTKSKYRL